MHLDFIFAKHIRCLLHMATVHTIVCVCVTLSVYMHACVHICVHACTCACV